MKTFNERYSKIKYMNLILVIAAILMLYAPFNASAITVSDVEEYLLSASCPGEPLSKCKSPASNQRRAEIKKMIQEGKTKDEILDYYVKTYGESVLTIPPKRGFNLIAYTAPSVGLVIGIVIAFFLVKKWGRKAQTAETETKETVEINSDMQQKIDDELSKLEED